MNKPCPFCGSMNNCWIDHNKNCYLRMFDDGELHETMEFEFAYETRPLEDELLVENKQLKEQLEACRCCGCCKWWLSGEDGIQPECDDLEGGSYSCSEWEART